MSVEEILVGLATETLKRAGMLAHGEGIGNLILSAGLVAVLIVAPLVLAIAYWMLRDSFRFGRDGFPWWVGAGVAAMFAGAGFWAAGWSGSWVGAPLLVAFGLGRGQRRRNCENA